MSIHAPDHLQAVADELVATVAAAIDELTNAAMKNRVAILSPKEAYLLLKFIAAETLKVEA